MSSPDTTREACRQSPICTDEKCHCPEYMESLKLTSDFHAKQMNLIAKLIRKDEV